jgi:FeS assembly SUF system protein
MHTIQERVIEALKSVYDPEIPVDVYELGLIYSIDIGYSKVDIDMTLTTANCPVAVELPVWVRDAVLKVEGIKECNVNMTMEPAWGPHLMSEMGQMILNMEGVHLPDHVVKETFEV